MIAEAKRVSPRLITVKIVNGRKNTYFPPETIKPSNHNVILHTHKLKTKRRERDLLSGEHETASDDELHAGEILNGDVIVESDEDQ